MSPGSTFYYTSYWVVVKLHYHVAGTGPAIVLIHGFLSDSRYWNKLVKELSSSHRVITVDLLGFGKSPKPRHAHYSLDQHAALVIDTLEPLLDEPAVVVGHSMGALISARISQRAPELVERLVLCNMPLYTSPEQARGVIKRTSLPYRLALYSPAARVLWPLIKSLAPRGKLRLGPAGAFSPHHTYQSRKRSLTHTVEATNALTLLHSLKAPTTLICGIRDRAVYRQNIEHEVFPRNITIKWVQTGHHTPLRHPELILPELG